MRVIETTLYKFSELSEEGKKSAIEKWRNDVIDTQHIYDDAHETVKKFHAIFGTQEARNSWLEFQTGQIEENVLQLKGLRLRTYLINNFEFYITSGKYYRSWTSDKKLFHKKVSSNQRKDTHGNISFWNVYRGLTREHSCELTGVCYDESLLAPMYAFIDKYTSKDTHTTFEDLLEECFSSLKKDVEAEEEYQYSEKAIIETIEANEYEFTENGELV